MSHRIGVMLPDQLKDVVSVPQPKFQRCSMICLRETDNFRLYPAINGANRRVFNFLVNLQEILDFYLLCPSEIKFIAITVRGAF